MEFSSSNNSLDKNRQKTASSGNVKTLSLSSATTAVAKNTNSVAENTAHKLELDHDRAMSMTGVKDVPVFTDKNITVRLAGETLLVTGQNLAVKNLDVESGKLQVTGRVFSLKYTSQTAPTSLIKRIFK